MTVCAEDARLYRRARYNDSALQALRKKYATSIQAIIQRHCKANDVEDLVQEFYLTLLSSHTYRVANVGRYLRKVAINTVHRYYAREKTMALIDVESLPEADDEEKKKLRICLDRLPEKYHHIVLAKYFFGFTLTEYAHRFGISVSYAKELHRKAIELLREEFNEYGNLDHSGFD